MKNWTRRNIKYSRLLKTISITLLVIVFAGTSCSDDDGNSISGVDKPACSISTETYNVTGKDGDLTYTLKYVITHGYDATGNVISESYTYDYSYSDGKKASSTNNASMQYDSKGFLIRSLRQYGSTDRSGKVTNSTQNDDFTYENERLIKDATQWIDNGVDRSYITTYAYNTDGKIVKTQNTYNNSSTSIQYDGNTVVKITYTDAGGNVTSPFIQYDASGRIIKTVDTSSGVAEEYRYEYTSDGLVAKEERYYNNKPLSSNIYEYDTKKNPYVFVYGKKKGFPVIPSARPEYLYIHNYTKITSLTASEDETTFVASSTTTYIYDYNGKDFPTSNSYKVLDSKGTQVSSTTVKYEYTDCQ